MLLVRVLWVGLGVGLILVVCQSNICVIGKGNVPCGGTVVFECAGLTSQGYCKYEFIVIISNHLLKLWREWVCMYALMVIELSTVRSSKYAAYILNCSNSEVFKCFIKIYNILTSNI